MEEFRISPTFRFLEKLNGNNNGSFRRWLDACAEEPRISWYPSCGGDARDLLYFREEYFSFKRIHPVIRRPDIYIHTDVIGDKFKLPFSSDTDIFYEDDRTKITAKSVERLADLNLPFFEELVVVEEFSNHVFFMMLEVRSDRLGIYEVPMIYCVTENTAFFAEEILKNRVRLTHISRVNYGGGLGGGSENDGFWIVPHLRKVGCELFVTDNHYNRPSRFSTPARELFPILGIAEDEMFDRAHVPQDAELRVKMLDQMKEEKDRGFVELTPGSMYDRDYRMIYQMPLRDWPAAGQHSSTWYAMDEIECARYRQHGQHSYLDGPAWNDVLDLF